MNSTIMNSVKNKTNSNSVVQADYFFQFLTYLPLAIIVLGVVCNTISLLIFRLHRDFKSMSLMIYLSFVTVTDTFSLFVWNVDNFLIYNFNLLIETFNEPVCHISTFIQYFSLQSSAVLLTMATIDRYFTVISFPGSFASKLPFRTTKSALYWSLVVLAFISVLNSHVLIFPRRKTSSSLGFNCQLYSTGFRTLTWEKVHLAVFSVIPFFLMTIFNGLLIKNAFMTGSRKATSNTRSSQKKKRVTISLVLVTIFFLVMTLPASIFFGYFYDYYIKQPYGPSLLIIMDSLSFLHSSSIFFITLATNTKFRNVLLVYSIKILRILSNGLSFNLLKFKDKEPSSMNTTVQ